MDHRKADSKYEVVVEQGGRPNIDGIFDNEKMAMDRAKYLLALARYSVVRVVRIGRKGAEETIFEKAYRGGGKVTSISHIDDSNVCTDVLQVFSFESRMTLLRLLRKYFNEEVVIPAEQLHRYYPLRYLEREAMLFNSGLSRLATLQAAKLGIQPSTRYEELARLFVQLKELAQNADVLAPFGQTLRRHGVAGLLGEVRTHRRPEERDRIVTHAFSTVLEQHGDWGSKVQAILSFHQEGNPAVEAVIDELLAETIDGREPIKALIGYAPDLASAVLSLVATLAGELDDRLPLTEPLLDLNNAVGGGMFPRVRAALLRRIHGGLDTTHPLTRQGGSVEGQAFATIVSRLARHDGFLGGPDMAAALTKRAKTALCDRDVDLPFEDAVRRLTDRLPGAAARIGYLLDLVASDYGHRKTSTLVNAVASQFDRIKSANELAVAGMSTEQVRKSIGERLRAAGIPRLLADQLVRKIASIPDQERTGGRSVTKETVDLSPAAETLLVIAYNGLAHELAAGGEGRLVVGRSHDCAIRIDVPSSSRRHAAFSVQNGRFLLTDTSRNGTRLVVEGRGPVLVKEKSVELTGSGEIYIGSPEAGETMACIAWEVRRAGE